MLDIRSKAVAFDNCSLLFVSVRQYSHYSGLIAIRDYSLFRFSRHPQMKDVNQKDDKQN